MKASSILLLYVLAVLSLASCRQVRYVPLETVKRDSVYLQQVKRDSIYRYDSVYIRDRGDTVEVVRYRYLFVDKLRRDTLYIERRDTVGVPVPVEKELTRWERVKLEAGGAAIGGFLLALVAIIAYIVYKSRKK